MDSVRGDLHMRKSYIVFFLLFLCVTLLIVQAALKQEDEKNSFDPGVRYPVDQLREDYALLRTALEESHAGLYYYSSKEEMTALFDSIYKKIEKPMTEPEFHKHLALLIAGINDGHTGMLPSQEYQTYLSNQEHIFPFNLRFIEKEAYLFRNYSELEDLTMGGELISLNDRSMSEIIKDMMPYIPSDGRIETSKYERLKRTEYFAQLYSLIYGVTTHYTFEYRSPHDGKVQELQVKGLRSGPLSQVLKQRYPEAVKEQPPIEIEYREDVAILTIRTFSDRPNPSTGTSFPGFLRKAFREFAEKDIKHLIVDLRRNGGGADLNGRLLFGYLIDEPYKYYNHLEIMRNEFSFLEHTDAPDINKMLKLRTKPNDKGTYDYIIHPNLGEMKPMKPTFTGQVFVMIDGGSFSGSGETTSLMHFYKRAKFVGEECGAGYYGNTSGIMPTLTLPHTQLRARIPMMRYHMAVSGYKYPDRGIIPDYPFTRSIEDLLADRDTELEYVLDLINK